MLSCKSQCHGEISIFFDLEVLWYSDSVLTLYGWIALTQVEPQPRCVARLKSLLVLKALKLLPFVPKALHVSLEPVLVTLKEGPQQEPIGAVSFAQLLTQSLPAESSSSSESGNPSALLRQGKKCKPVSQVLLVQLSVPKKQTQRLAQKKPQHFQVAKCKLQFAAAGVAEIARNSPRNSQKDRSGLVADQESDHFHVFRITAFLGH